jgi:hypothetical protein
VREWGRIGQPGALREESYETPALAEAAELNLLRRKERQRSRAAPSLRSVVNGLGLGCDFRMLAGVARRRVPTAGGGRGWQDLAPLGRAQARPAARRGRAQGRLGQVGEQPLIHGYHICHPPIAPFHPPRD